MMEGDSHTAEPCDKYQLKVPLQVFTSLVSLSENQSVEMELASHKNNTEKSIHHLTCQHDSTHMNMFLTLSRNTSLFTQVMDKLWKCEIVDLDKVHYVDTQSVDLKSDSSSGSGGADVDRDAADVDHFTKEELTNLRSQGSFRCFLCGFLVKRRNRPYFKNHLQRKHGLDVEKYNDALSLDDHSALRELTKLRADHAGRNNGRQEKKAKNSHTEETDASIKKNSDEHNRPTMQPKPIVDNVEDPGTNDMSSLSINQVSKDALPQKIFQECSISCDTVAQDLVASGDEDDQKELSMELFIDETVLMENQEGEDSPCFMESPLDAVGYAGFQAEQSHSQEVNESMKLSSQPQVKELSGQVKEATRDTQNVDIAQKQKNYENMLENEMIKKDKLHQCFSCQCSFDNLTKLIYHYSNSHKQDEDFVTNLLELESARNSMKKFPHEDIVSNCPYCNVSRIGWSIISHMRLFHKEEAGFDDVLQGLDQRVDSQYKNKKSQKTKAQLMEQKKEGKVWLCNYCQKQFNHRSSMSRHRSLCSANPSSVNKARKHRCSVCQKNFGSLEEMRAHQATHDPVNFVCDVCGKAYKNMSGVTVHKRREHNMAVKNPIKLHVCEVCDKSFYQKTQWRFHVQSHSETKEIACDLCSKVFKQVKDVARHKNRMHFNKYPYHCPQCGHGVDKRKYLVNHVCGRVKRAQGTQSATKSKRSRRTSKKTDKPPVTPHEIPPAPDVMEMLNISGGTEKRISQVVDIVDVVLPRDPQPSTVGHLNNPDTPEVSAPTSLMTNIFEASASDPDRFLHNPGVVQVRGTNHNIMEAVPVYAIMDMQENPTNPVVSLSSTFSSDISVQPSIFQLPPLQISAFHGFVSTVGTLSPNTDPQAAIQNQALSSMFPTLEGMMLPQNSQDGTGFY